MARGWIIYTRDDGINVSIKATTATAVSNGQTLSKFPPVARGWEYNYRDLRHFCGVDSTGTKRARMTVCDATLFDGAIGNVTWTSAGGTTYTVTSSLGERMDARDAG